jgi:hypothetical protein
MDFSPIKKVQSQFKNPLKNHVFVSHLRNKALQHTHKRLTFDRIECKIYIVNSKT